MSIWMMRCRRGSKTLGRSRTVSCGESFAPTTSTVSASPTTALAAACPYTPAMPTDSGCVSAMALLPL